MRNVIIGALAVLAGSSAAAHASTVYDNNFNDGTHAGFVITGAQAATDGIFTTPDGTRFIGMLTQGATADLTLTGLTVGSTLDLAFDVYGFHSLDNNNPSSPGGDYFNVFAGSSQIVHDLYGFVTCNGGCYTINTTPADLPVTGVRTGYDDNGFGTGNSFTGVATYHYALTLNNIASSTLNLSFVGAANQGWGDEGFGLDNVVINQTAPVTGGVPEPAIWVSMIGGFGLAGAALRRRKTLVAA